MNNRKKLLIAGGAFLCLILVIAVALAITAEEDYPGMIRISSRTAQGSHERCSPSIELPGLKAEQLVVIESSERTGAKSSWVRHSSTETFVIEGRNFEDGKMEYEVHEDADYSFQLNCSSTNYSLSISVWEKVE